MYRFILIFSVILVFTYQQTGAKTEAKQKNVLFIFSDDMNTELNCYGNSLIHSPNIDRLAEKGTHFTHAYCQWSVCGPSRASILSGQMPAQTGVRDLKTQLRDVNPDIVTLPQYFKNKGYVTAAVGKIFDPRTVDDGHDKISWTIPYNINYSYPKEYGSFIKGQYRVKNNTATEMGPEGVGDDGYLDGQICLDALSKLENFASKPNQPFFLAVGFKKPHIPFISPKEYWDLYQRENMPLSEFQQLAEGSPEFSLFKPEPKQYDDIPDVWTYDDVNKGDGILDTAIQKQLIHGYYACISYVDAQVGKLISKLDELGLDDNTIVVFISDHGYHLGDHNQWGKHTQLENGVHVPFIIYELGLKARQCDATVDLLDLYPTLTNMVFQTNPENTTGKSLMPLLEGQESNNIAVSEFRSSGHSSYSFRDDKNRLTLWMKSTDDRPDQQEWKSDRISTVELFDYDTDQLERINLYDNPVYKNVVKSLLKSGEIWWNSQYNLINKVSTGDRSLKEEGISSENPVHDYLQLPLDENQHSSIRIYDSKGNVVLDKESPGRAMYVGNLKPGRYTVLVNWGKMDEVMNYSFIKI